MELLLARGAIPLKDAEGDKDKLKSKGRDKDKSSERSGKKGAGAKKKQIDRNTLQKYVLTIFKDGNWHQVSPEELNVFLDKNKEVAGYLNNPDLLQTLKIPPLAPTVQIYDHWDKAAKRVLSHLWKQPGAWHFFAPVDPIALKIPDYPEIIKHPMDFGTIKQKILSAQYQSCKEFVGDLELVFSNCITYNGETSDFGVLAKKLREEFQKQAQLLSLHFYM
jgi:hypothetical protein